MFEFQVQRNADGTIALGVSGSDSRAYAAARPAEEFKALNENYNVLANEMDRISIDASKLAEKLKPDAYQEALTERFAAMTDHFQRLQTAVAKVKQDNFDYETNRDLIPQAGPITPEIRDIRARLALISKSELAQKLLDNASLAELDAALRTDGFDALEIDPELRKRLEARRLELAHAEWIRKHISEGIRQKPTLENPTPLAHEINEPELSKIVADASAQRLRRIDDADNAQQFLKQFVNVVAVATATTPANAWAKLMGQSDA
ncbi:hypothetical protein V6617_16825 [Pelagibacterium nitratireducens]|uniref:Uncharacterized protein n=1 Tax=Pelagibacterium nitratireducens TaxID=1046114 RepID=A0ABZ2I507_9HYPH